MTPLTFQGKMTSAASRLYLCSPHASVDSEKFFSLLIARIEGRPQLFLCICPAWVKNDSRKTVLGNFIRLLGGHHGNLPRNATLRATRKNEVGTSSGAANQELVSHGRKSTSPLSIPMSKVNEG
jgi:hypothetical protein